MATKELSIKLLIDTKTDKVCFAEASSDVVNFLSGLLSLPLGTIANLLPKERIAGSISNILGGIEKLDPNYRSKEARLSPAVTNATLCRLQQLLGSHLRNGLINLLYTYVHGVLSYMTYTIKDDLSVTPASNAMSGIAMLSQCGVKDISAMQEQTVKIGKEEALAILVASLKSKTVLTDVFLTKKNARCKREPPEEVIQI
ncbi:hypothetical protein ACQ4PT_046369 [Festuca glaucescens]